jgi:membrane associated rhomboid family serine protease
MITIIIIAITCIVSYMAWQNPSLQEKLLYYPYGIKNDPKQWYRIVTNGFVHADMPHLGFNMFSFFMFGRQLEEQVFGPLLFLLFYVSAIIASCLFNYFKHQNNRSYRALGASGAVTAMIFSYILFAPWADIYIYFIKLPAIVFAGLYVGYSFYMSKKQIDNVGHDVHLWGALYGLLFTLACFPNSWGNFLNNILHP